MPTKPARTCRSPYCPTLTRDPSGYCDAHASLRGIQRGLERRENASRRGYGHEWRKIRIEALKRFGIPEYQWPQYDIDHNPRYNPAIEPNHRRYELIPRLRADHSRKTNRFDGGFGRNTRGGIESLALSDIDRSGYPYSHSTDSQGKGVGRA